MLRAASQPDAAPDTEALLRQAVALGHDVAPDAIGCSITTLDGERYFTPVSSGGLALDLDEAQYRSGDGPCMAAAREHRYHDFDAATDAARFPGFTEAAVERGVRSSISLPLTGTARPSAINLYGSSRHAFDAERPQAVASLLARCISTVLSRPAATEPGGVVPSARLAAARDQAQLITAAETALMDSRSVSRPDALTMLMHRSRTEARSIFDLAREVVRDSEGAQP
ncbi:GAF domain-containing protein [Jatrophihabitans sp.]|uniref:GAF domain-containing protein n=1 Tax=Jatrophihabitans sp. TaxID=1932789 RepID=UPI002BBBEDC9|nr:GAF domain-containing protein [Jatrophihabitans sp.]